MPCEDTARSRKTGQADEIDQNGGATRLLSDAQTLETERPRPPLHRRLLTDSDCRRKSLLTLNACFSYLMLGWITVQTGVSLTDLQVKVDVDLETGAWIFTSWSLGFILGSLVSGQLLDRLNRLVIMAVCSIGSGLCCLLVPWCPNFVVLVAVRALAGVFMGSVDTGCNTILPSIWGSEAAPFMQVMYLSFTVGGFLSPPATYPFLNPKFTSENHPNESILSNYTLNARIVNNYSIPSTEEKTLTLNPQNSVLHLAFAISCILTVITAVPYLCMGYQGHFDVQSGSRKKQQVDSYDSHTETGGEIAAKPKFCILAFLGLVNLTYSATEESIGDFLVTFCLLELGWDKGDAVTLMSLYWISSCVGALVGILVVQRVGITPLILAAFVGWLLAFSGLLLGSLLQVDGLVWVCVTAAGSFMVLILPMVISWTEVRVCDISGRVSSIFMISTGMGLTVNPVAIGNAMERVSNMYFVYILMAEMLLCFSCFLVSYMLTRQYRPGNRETTIVV